MGQGRGTSQLASCVVQIRETDQRDSPCSLRATPRPPLLSPEEWRELRLANKKEVGDGTGQSVVKAAPCPSFGSHFGAPQFPTAPGAHDHPDGPL